MGLTIYVDDSGSDPTSTVYILGTVCLPERSWTMAIEEWRGVLSRSPSISYLKASEVWERDVTKNTPFVHFTNEERMQKIDELVGVLSKYEPMTASFEISWSVFSDFKSKFSLPKGNNDPYFYLYYGVMLLYPEWGVQYGNMNQFDFVFDEHGSIGKRVNQWYPAFKSRCPPEISLRIGSDPTFADEKCVMPLQAADLFSWYARRKVIGSLNNDWHKGIWAALSTHYSKGVIEMQHLIQIGRMVGFIQDPT